MKKGKRELRRVNVDTLIVAVDIGSRTNKGYCTTMHGDALKPVEFENSKEGFEKLWNTIITGKERFHCADVVVGYESTGSYAEPLLHYFMEKPVRMVQVNPMHTKRVKEINDNSPLKTDDKDPRIIADIIRLGHALSIVVPQGEAAFLRRLHNARERHMGERIALMNQLQQRLFLIFPEFTKVFHAVKGKTALFILRKYTTPEVIGALKNTELSEEIRKQSMGKFGHNTAETLTALARETVGIKEGIAGLVMDIRHILMQLEMIERFIAEIESTMKEVLDRISYSTRLLAIPGLGVVTVAGLIGEVGDFTKFAGQSEIVKLAGLDLYEVSSGKRKGQRKISKRGRAMLRKILYFAAIQTVRKHGIMHQYYSRLTIGEKSKTSALIAVAKKLLRIVYAIVRDGSEYIPDYALQRKVIRKAA